MHEDIAYMKSQWLCLKHIQNMKHQIKLLTIGFAYSYFQTISQLKPNWEMNK